MAVALILLIAANSRMSSAKRLKDYPVFTSPSGDVSDTMIGYTRHQMSLSRTQMQVATPSGNGWKARISDTWTPQQTFPPITIDCIDARQLLHNWAVSLLDPFERKAGTVANVNMTALLNTPKYCQDDKAMVLHHMHDVIAKARRSYTPPADINGRMSRMNRARLLNLLLLSKKYEMVGLLPQGLQIPVLECRSSGVDASVLAVGVFSRVQLRDDSNGSLRKRVEEQFGKQWTRHWWGGTMKKLRVFAIEGLADTPGLSEHSARVLLCKIGKYAHEEKKIIVVPSHAYISRDGTDLTDYYVRLGFEKIEMKDGHHELVYMGTSSQAEDPLVTASGEEHRTLVGRLLEVAEERQTMVTVNLYTGASG